MTIRGSIESAGFKPLKKKTFHPIFLMGIFNNSMFKLSYNKGEQPRLDKRRKDNLPTGVI
jgi:hypothetical protein